MNKEGTETNQEVVAKKESMSFTAIRSVLWDEIHGVRSGDTTAMNLSAITNAAGKILSSVALEVKLCQITGAKPSNDVKKMIEAPKEKLD